MHREIVAVLSFRGMRVSKIKLKLFAESPSRACRVLMMVGGGKMKNITSLYKNGFSSICEYEINGKWKKELIYVKIDNGIFEISHGEAEAPGKYHDLEG